MPTGKIDYSYPTIILLYQGLMEYKPLIIPIPYYCSLHGNCWYGQWTLYHKQHGNDTVTLEIIDEIRYQCFSLRLATTTATNVASYHTHSQLYWNPVVDPDRFPWFPWKPPFGRLETQVLIEWLYEIG
jgi:hypothetical protein